MRCFLLLLLLSVGCAAAQKPQTAPEPPSEIDTSMLIIRGVQAAAAAATKGCSNLPEVRSYQRLLSDANAFFKARGEAVDWATGAITKTIVK